MAVIRSVRSQLLQSRDVERSIRIGKLWLRFRRLMERDGRESAEMDLILHCNGRVNYMRVRIAAGIPAGWYWRSQQEVSDLGMEIDLDLPAPDPCDGPPGSPEKLAALARRYRSGRQLWDAADVDNAGQPLGTAKTRRRRG